MNVEKLMQNKPATCRPEDSLNEAARIMWEGDCGSVPILDSQGRVVGMVTDRDACMACYTQGRALSEIRIAEVMSRDVCVCSPDQSIESAEELMQKRQVRRMPVTDRKGRLVGILALGDIAGQAADGGSRIDPRSVIKTLAAVSRPAAAAG